MTSRADSWSYCADEISPQDSFCLAECILGVDHGQCEPARCAGFGLDRGTFEVEEAVRLLSTNGTLIEPGEEDVNTVSIDALGLGPDVVLIGLI